MSRHQTVRRPPLVPPDPGRAPRHPRIPTEAILAVLAPILVVWTLAAPAGTHEATPRHGGRVAEAGPYHVELVGRGGAVDVFVTDEDGRPVPARGFSGTAILIVTGKPTRIPLAPAQGDRLTGTAPVPIEPLARGALLITAPDGRSASARFE